MLAFVVGALVFALGVVIGAALIQSNYKTIFKNVNEEDNASGPTRF